MPAKTAPVDNFDETLKEMTPQGYTVADQAIFGVAALAASFVPTYLFASKFFSVSMSYSLIFIAVTIASAVLLVMSYNKLAIQELGRVMARKRTFNEVEDEAASKKEAAAYAMFIANLIYVLAVFLLAFVIMPRFNMNLPTYAVYVLVAGLADALTFGFSYGMI